MAAPTGPTLYCWRSPYSVIKGDGEYGINLPCTMQGDDPEPLVAPSIQYAPYLHTRLFPWETDESVIATAGWTNANIGTAWPQFNVRDTLLDAHPSQRAVFMHELQTALDANGVPVIGDAWSNAHLSNPALMLKALRLVDHPSVLSAYRIAKMLFEMWADDVGGEPAMLFHDAEKSLGLNNGGPNPSLRQAIGNEAFKALFAPGSRVRAHLPKSLYVDDVDDWAIAPGTTTTEMRDWEVGHINANIRLTVGRAAAEVFGRHWANPDTSRMTNWDTFRVPRGETQITPSGTGGRSSTFGQPFISRYSEPAFYLFTYNDPTSDDFTSSEAIAGTAPGWSQSYFDLSLLDTELSALVGSKVAAWNYLIHIVRWCQQCGRVGPVSPFFGAVHGANREIQIINDKPRFVEITETETHRKINARKIKFFEAQAKLINALGVMPNAKLFNYFQHRYSTVESPNVLPAGTMPLITATAMRSMATIWDALVMPSGLPQSISGLEYDSDTITIVPASGPTVVINYDDIFDPDITPVSLVD